MVGKFSFVLFFCIVFLIALGSISEIGAQAEYKDTPYFSGMPNFNIGEATDQEFADYRFYNGKDCTTVEGEKYFRAYSLKEGAQPSSGLQISRNYSNAVKSMGGTVIFEGECSGADCAENCGGRLMIGKVVKGDNELWLEVAPYESGDYYYLTVVAKKLMKQDVTAGNMYEALQSTGRFALYINFDSGKSLIKSEFKPTIQQIADMLKANPELKISVEGHTDNTGDRKANQGLSVDRAKAVVSEIIAQGIDSKRLSAAGYGPDKPIADNNTEEGKAKNRRVELVRQ